MGYAFGIAPCYGCRTPFSFNPKRVPSLRDKHGIRQPICQSCMLAVNVARAAKGMEEIKILADAYEPVHESEL